jgi:hypothetical protein
LANRRKRPDERIRNQEGLEKVGTGDDQVHRHPAKIRLKNLIGNLGQNGSDKISGSDGNGASFDSSRDQGSDELRSKFFHYINNGLNARQSGLECPRSKLHHPLEEIEETRTQAVHKAFPPGGETFNKGVDRTPEERENAREDFL